MLVDWSLTSNFLGLFRLWKALQFYAGFSIFMLYVYQLPIEFSSMLQWIADFVGLFKICSTSEWTEICSSVSLVLFYNMVSNRIHCETNKGCISNIINEVEKLHLSVLNSNALPFGQATLYITIVAQMEDEFSMTLRDLVKTLREGLLSFM